MLLFNMLNEAYKDFDCTPIYLVDLIWDGTKDLSSKAFAEIAEEEKSGVKGLKIPSLPLKV